VAPERSYRRVAPSCNIISVELPATDWNNDLELAELVRLLIIYNPCGNEYRNAPCIVKNEVMGCYYCSKGFPKPFINETIVQENGYPTYCHCNDLSISFQKRYKGKEVVITNQ
jgi:hypothetical protein